MPGTTMVIDLEGARIPRDTGVLSGRDAGARFRHKSEVDRLDKETEKVKVRIPAEIFSINTSFFLGLFGDSVRALGPAGFRDKYEFEGDMEVHGPTVARGITLALKKATIFDRQEKSA